MQYVLAPYFTPGNGWHYSNTNFVLLWMIINRITHNSFKNEMHSRFYDPLQLTQAFTELDYTLTVPLVHNWVDLNCDGIETPTTCSAPSASTAIAAVNAESMPPESPSRTVAKPFLRT